MPPTLILDLDNTIIGNITYQLLAHTLCNKVKKNCGMVANCYNEKTGIIRPYFCKFIYIIREKFPDIKIYVYTASQKDWALKEIKWIEKCCNLKFDRPILTRDDCIEMDNSYYKSIQKISKRIKTLDKNNILIIDNNDVFVDCKESFIKCPDYNYISFVDLWKVLPKAMLDKQEVLTFMQKLIKEGYINPYNVDAIGENIEQSLRYLHWYQKKLTIVNKINRKSYSDSFWKTLIKIVYNVNNFKDIKMIYNIESKT
jgi:hypothetical protein